MGVILVEGICCFSYHGCMDEEARIGTDYEIDVKLNTDFSKSMVSDDLKDTVDYVLISQIVQQEMAIRSELIEHVGKRIIDRILAEASGVDYVEVLLRKLNPPINGDVTSVSVIVSSEDGK